MLKKRPVVVGFDGSAAARKAALWAADHATRNGLPLSLICAVALGGCSHEGSSRPSPARCDGLRAEARHELRVLAEELLESHPHLAVECWVEQGRPHAVLIEQSAHATLMVLGSTQETTDRTGLPSGCVAHSVAAYGHSPVAVIPHRGRGPESGPVVVGVDGSPAGEDALVMALETAAARRTELVAVHASNDYTNEIEYRYIARCGSDWEQTRAREEEVLAGWLAEWQDKYPNVLTSTVVAPRPPALCLAEYGATAQLLIVGARGLGGFSGLRLGSTSAALLRRSPCPLIVVRH